MTLRFKTIIFISSVAAISLVSLYFITQVMILDQFKEMERKSVEASVQRTLDTLEDELANMSANFSNFSAWDDTYQFVGRAKPLQEMDAHPYILSNYAESTFIVNRVNMILLIDELGQIIFERAYDLKKSSYTPVPQNIYQHLKFDGPLVNHETSTSQVKGFVMLDDVPLLIVSQPITTTDYQGVVRGTMIVARYVDDEEWVRLAQKFNQKVRILTNQERMAALHEENNLIHLYTLNERMMGSVLIKDIYQQPAFVVEIDSQTDFFLQGKKSVEWFYLFLLTMGSMFTIMMVFFLDRTILARLLTFTQQLSYIRQNHDLSARVSYKGNDEISKLKKEFNRMMSSMEEYQRKLSFQAYHDTLTGLPNRTLFIEKLEQSIARAIQDKDQGALLFLDLDDFKPLNDTFGHDVGDLLLQKVTERLQRCIRSNDVISRLGGDEFTILLPSIQSRVDAENISKIIIHSLSQPFQLEEYHLCISVSIGLTLFPDDGVDSTILIKNGDLATLRVKERGGNDLQWYTDEINKTWDRKMLVEHQLRQALERNEMMLVYQPKMDLLQGRIVGAEALVRWKSPLLGQVSPAEFIPIAETSGQIIELGEWVLRTACQQWKMWFNRGLPPIIISVNLSALQIKQQDFVERIQQIMLETNMQPQYLELEITETVLMQEVDKTIAKLKQLKDQGIHLSIDDFGTGYSSLSYLKQLPINVIKIDRSFISNVSLSASDSAITKAIIDLGHYFNLKVIAEGVETLQQCEFLRENGCDEIQGYFVSAPMKANDFEFFCRV